MGLRTCIPAAAVAVTLAACTEALAPPEATTDPVLAAGQSEHRPIGGAFSGPPFWATVADGLLSNTDDLAIVPFLRQLHGAPGEVCGADAPDLTVLDPTAFSCPLTVGGFEHWQDGRWDDGLPWDGSAPRHNHFRGLGAVPFVFVDRGEFEAVMAGGLSGAELLGLPSAVVGYADSFQAINVLGLSGPQGMGGGKYTMSARGTLEDGRSFRLLVTESPGVVRRVTLEIGS